MAFTKPCVNYHLTMRNIMTKEESTLIVDLINLAKRAGYTITITKNGSVIREICPSQPFTVKDGEVRMEPAPVDYEAIGRDVAKLIGFNMFDPRKHLGDTFNEAAQSWREDIASVSSEKAENLKVDVDSIRVEGALTPDDVAQAFLETIGEAVGPSSDIVISIGTLNVNVG